MDARLSSKTMTSFTFSLAMSQAGTYVISAFRRGTGSKEPQTEQGGGGGTWQGGGRSALEPYVDGSSALC